MGNPLDRVMTTGNTDPDWTMTGKKPSLNTPAERGAVKDPHDGKARVRAVHLSQRYTRGQAAVEKSTDYATTIADIISNTEVNATGAALKEPGWSVARTPGADNNGEVGIMSRDSVWTLVRHETYTIGPDPGPGGRVVAVLALYIHNETKKTLLYTVTHMPSGVEPTWNKGSYAGTVWLSSLATWRKRIGEWRKLYRPSAEIAVADFNVNIRLTKFREFFTKTFSASAGLRLPSAAELPDAGTHAGGRLIDFPLTRGIRALLISRMKSLGTSDHRGIVIRGWF